VILRLFAGYGAVVWLTGQSGAGKSTIATHLEERLLSKAVLSMQLDPKAVFQGLCSDLGSTRLARSCAPPSLYHLRCDVFLVSVRRLRWLDNVLKLRAETLRRVTEVAKHIADAGLVAIASFVTPLRAERAAAREALHASQNRFFEVYVAAAKATLFARGGADDCAVSSLSSAACLPLLANRCVPRRSPRTGGSRMGTSSLPRRS